MLQKRAIHTQFVLVLLVALLTLTAVLQIIHLKRTHDERIQANREQSLAIGGSLVESMDAFDYFMASLAEQEEISGFSPLLLMPLVFNQFSAGFSDFVTRHPNVAFETLALSNGAILIHSSADYQGKTLADANLENLPLDKTILRRVPGYGRVYLTRVQVEPLTMATTEPMSFVVGIRAQSIGEEIGEGLASSTLTALGVLGVVGLIAVYFVRRNIADPIRQVQVGAQSFSQGNLEHRITLQGTPELRDLASTLNQMAVVLQHSRKVSDELYAVIRERTRDLEISAEIGRIATGLRDVKTLLHETVGQIRRRFDQIYHAQVFLLDDMGEYAVLVESSGEVGRRLLALDHRLKKGSPSVIGRVTATNETVIASDTQKSDVPWQPNPLLPDTRAEMALPLSIEGRVIGALDVQSTEPDVFTEEMVQVFQVLADQLAIAIENARLLEESEKRVREIDHLNLQLTHSVWQEFLSTGMEEARLGYLYDQMNLRPLAPDAAPSLARNQIEAPIKVRGQIIGQLLAATPDGSRLSEDDTVVIHAVADRVALALENARLFQQTQQALAETERLYEAARTVSSTNDLQAIYQLVIEQLSTSQTTDHVHILLAGPDPTLIQYLEDVYCWSRSAPLSFVSTHERFTILSPLDTEEARLPARAPTVLNDVPDTHPLHSLLAQLGAQSLLLAPMTAGGRWFGLVMCASARPGSFHTTYAAFASALADQLAIAIDNRRLFEEAQTEARRARALAEAGQLASQIGGDYEAGLQTLFEAVSGPGRYNRWWFGLLIPDESTLNRVTASGAALPEQIQISHDQNALAEAARIGEIVLVNDPSDHPVVEEDPAQFTLWGKHIAAPVKIGTDLVGVLLTGRDPDDANLDERDIQLAATLASQIAVATQNRILFDQAESERQNLQTILDTMPTGVLVMDETGSVLLSNQRLQELLGPALTQSGNEPLAPDYSLVRTGTEEPYAPEEWPLERVFRTGQAVTADDITIQHPDGTMLHVMANAAPVLDEQGEITAVIGAFQDITELHELERALQNSLLETTMLYEVSRSISRATSREEVVQTALRQTASLRPAQTFFLLKDDQAGIEPDIALAASDSPDTLPPLDLGLVKPLLSDEASLLHLDSDSEDARHCLQTLGFAMLGIFPLSIRGYVNGWMVLGFDELREFKPEERRFLTTLTDQTAISLENQQLVIRTEEALQETARLYQASSTIAGAQGLSDVLEAFVSDAVPTLASQAVLYLLVGDSLDAPYATIETAARWSADESDLPEPVRCAAREFPFVDIFAGAEITWTEDVSMPEGISEAARLALELMQIQSAIYIPLVSGIQPIGLILVGMPTPWMYSENEIRFYNSLADQAAVAVENTRLYEQAQRRARQLATSAEISRAVTSILQLDELFPQVVNLIRDSFNYDHVQIFMIDETGVDAQLAASTGEAGRRLLEIRHSLAVGSASVIGQVTARGKPHITLDTHDPSIVHMANPYLPNTRSEMALPLFVRGKIVGALDVQSNQPGAFTDEDARALASLAELVATAIDNARLFELSQQRAEEMSFLFNVMTAAATSADPDEAMQQVVEMLRSTLNAVGASFYLPDESGRYMFKGARTSHQDDVTELSTLEIERGLIGWVARHYEAVIINDLSQDPRQLPSGSTARSAIALPLQSAGILVGVLLVEGDQPSAFDENDLRLLQTLAGSLAAIIQNARLLREVQRANEQLLEVDRLKTNFLAAMSHELRTPLNSIIGFSRVILKGIDGPLTETQEQDLTTIYDSGKHLLGLVNDILDQAKIEAGKMELSFAYFKVQDVIHGVMSTAVGLTREKGLRLDTQIDESLPEAYGDEFRTRQVLLNLVSNASKFTFKGGITVAAFPIVEEGRTLIQVSVSDTGVGIADKDMPLLFEPFQQVDNSTTRAVEGTGMGLPLAKSLTELQGGRIWVESEPGAGSTFSITIPTTPPPEELAEEASTEDAPLFQVDAQTVDQVALADSRQPIVLVIDPSAETIDLYHRYLSHIGHEVIGTTHPDELAALVPDYYPTAILLDVNWPDIDGWSLLEQLTQNPLTASIPIIVCSINADSQRGLQLGAADFLVKPFTEDRLHEAVRQAQAVGSRARIVIVDDKPETIRPLCDALEATNQYDILEVTTGQEALHLIEQLPHIDLMILDLRMPGIDGFEILQALRGHTNTANVPVLVLTAEDITADERDSLSTTDIYRKDSLDEEHLLQMVQAQLKNTEGNR